MIPGNASNFDKKWLLLCEGAGDQRFFYRLLTLHNLEAHFAIRFPETEGSGRSAFGSDLNGVIVNEDFIQNVKAILIVSDNDESPETSFAEVKAEIEKVKQLPVPSAERQVAKKKDAPAVVVLMLPIDSKGALETLCLEAAHKKWELKEPVEDFIAKTPATGWDISKKSKAKIHAILASTNHKQPDAGFASSWSQKEKYRIPIDHECFNSLVEFLKNFDQLVGEGE